MATTNLISKSLGNVLTQSGVGSPDHTANKGSLYSDISTGVVYQNKDGATAWEQLKTVAYDFGYYQNNTNATTITATTTWFIVSNTFTDAGGVGLSASTNSLVVQPGYGGTYEVSFYATIAWVAGTNQYEVGVSINNANPAAGAYNGSIVDITYTRQTISASYITTLSAGDTLKLAARSLTAANNIIIRNAQLIVRKV